MSVSSLQADPFLRIRRQRQLLLVDRFEPNLKQQIGLAHLDEDGVDEVCLHGAIRSGKTQLAMRSIVRKALRWNRTLWVIMRSTKQELEDSTKPILLDGVEMPPILPEELIAGGRRRGVNSTYNQVRLVNGSVILLRSLEPLERGKIRNATFAGMMIDQAEEMDKDGDEEYYVELVGRISDPRTDRKMVVVANPSHESHWICRRFGLTEEEEARRPDELRQVTRQVHFDILDNAHNLEPKYLAKLLGTRHTAPDYFKRMVRGLWGSHGGKRFKSYHRSVHVHEEPFDVPSEWDCVEMIDWGSLHDTAVLWALIDLFGRWWFVHEHVQNGWTVAQQAAAIKILRRNDPEADNTVVIEEAGERRKVTIALPPFRGSLEPSATWLGPDAWNQTRKEIATVADSFVDAGIHVAKAQNERIGGWNRLEEHLNKRLPWKDGELPALQIFPHLRVLPAQISAAVYKPGVDDIEKKFDDALDGCRYGLMTRTPPPREKQREPARTRKDLIHRARERATGKRPKGTVTRI